MLHPVQGKEVNVWGILKCSCFKRQNKITMRSCQHLYLQSLSLVFSITYFLLQVIRKKCYKNVLVLDLTNIRIILAVRQTMH